MKKYLLKIPDSVPKDVITQAYTAKVFDGQIKTWREWQELLSNGMSNYAMTNWLGEIEEEKPMTAKEYIKQSGPIKVLGISTTQPLIDFVRQREVKAFKTGASEERKKFQPVIDAAIHEMRHSCLPILQEALKQCEEIE